MMNFSLNSIFSNWYIQKYGLSSQSAEDVSLYANLKDIKEFLADKYNINDSLFSQSVDDVLSFDFFNPSANIPVEDTDIPNEINDNDALQNPKLVDLLSEILSDEEVMQLIGGDSATSLSDDEIAKFIEDIKGLDGKEEDVSLDDLLQGIEALQSQDVEVETEQTPTEEVENTQEIVKNKKSKSTRRSRSSGSSNDVKKANNKNLDTMDDNALQAELKAREDAFSTNSDILKNLSNGTDSTLSSLKTAMDESFFALESQLKFVDGELAEQFSNAKAKVDEQQAIVDTANLNCTNQQVQVSQLSNQYINAQHRTQTLKATQIELNSIDISQLEPTEAQEIATKKQKIAIEVQKAMDAENTALILKQKAESDLAKMQEDKNAKEALLNEYKTDRDKIELNISNAHPELATLQTNYNESKKAYYEYKDTQTSKAQTAVLDSQSAINEVQTVQQNRKLKNEVKDLSPNPLSQYDEEWGRIISEAAKKYASEGHGTSCGASVRKVLESLGYDYIQCCKGKEWAETNLVNSPDFVEVEFSLEDIKEGNVPIGSICCFSEYDSFGYGDGKSGHVGIVIDNNGTIAEASGYIRKAGINTNIIELGHGTVRIFVPTGRPS